MKVKVSKEYEKAAAEIRKTDAYKRARVISDFTERICRRLEELGINQSEFARRLGVTRAYVTNFLRGNVNFTFDTAVRISTALGMDFEATLVTKDDVVAQCGRIPVDMVKGAMRVKLNSSWRPAIMKPCHVQAKGKGAGYEDTAVALG